MTGTNNQIQSGTTPIAINNGGTGSATVISTPTVSSWAGWDANNNLSANNINQASSTTATSAGTTTLTVGSSYYQFFTGVLSQTLIMPVVSTLTLGQSWFIVNNSTGVVTVESSGANTILAMSGGASAIVTCIALTGTTAASWSYTYLVQSAFPGNPGMSFTGTWIAPIEFTFYSLSALQNGVFVPNLLSATIDDAISENNLLTLDLGSIQQIIGAFSFTSTSLTSINASSLINIYGNLAGLLSVVTTFTFPALINVGGAITITLPLVTTVSFPDLTYVGGQFNPLLASVTTLSLPSLITIEAGFQGTYNVLTTISLPVLTFANAINTTSAPLLTSFSAPDLVTLGAAGSGGMSSTFPSLTTLTLSSLVTLGGNFTPTLASLTTLNLSTLVTGTEFAPTVVALTSLNLSSLTTLSTNFGGTYTVLTTISLPAITHIGTTISFTAPALTTFSMNSGLLSVGGNVTMTGMALSQASVDGILVSLANLNGSGGTTSYNSKTVNLSGGTSSTPSATGLAAKATLVARSCTVTTN